MNSPDFSKLQDRGMQKWRGMMITEHVALLKAFDENQKKAPRPELDEWDLAAIQETIEIAMKRNVEVTIKTWCDGEFIFKVGKVTWIDLINRKIEMEDVIKTFTVKLEDVVDVSILEEGVMVWKKN